MIVAAVHRFVPAALAAAAFYGLTAALGGRLALGVWAAGTGVACLTGAVLLRTSAVGRVTWKNRAAAYLVPWGYRLNRGRLWPIVLVSWLVWVLIGVATAFAFTYPPPAEDGDSWAGWPVLLLAAWAVDGGAILYVLGTWVTHFWHGGGGRSLPRILVVLAGLIAGSVGLVLAGRMPAAVLLAGGPPLVVALGYGSFLGMLLVFGRNARWN